MGGAPERDGSSRKPSAELVIVGDSFSDPKHHGYPEYGVDAWPVVLARETGACVHNYASSGDGYTHLRTITFADQAKAAAADTSFDHSAVDLVVIYGGINDSSSGEDLDAVRDAAASAARTLADAFPNALVQGFMNWYPHTFDDVAKTYIAAIEEGLSTAGVPLRTDSMWILENDHVADAYLPDNLHPNQHGHNLMAEFFREALGL